MRVDWAFHVFQQFILFVGVLVLAHLKQFLYSITIWQHCYNTKNQCFSISWYFIQTANKYKQSFLTDGTKVVHFKVQAICPTVKVIYMCAYLLLSCMFCTWLRSTKRIYSRISPPVAPPLYCILYRSTTDHSCQTPQRCGCIPDPPFPECLSRHLVDSNSAIPPRTPFRQRRWALGACVCPFGVAFSLDDWGLPRSFGSAFSGSHPLVWKLAWFSSTTSRCRIRTRRGICRLWSSDLQSPVEW